MENKINMKEKIEMESFEDYCKRIGVSFGNLYSHDIDNKVKLYISTDEERKRKPELLYDKATGNVHMTPDDLILAEQRSKDIEKIGTDILHYIKEEIEKEECYQNINCKRKRLSQAKIFDGTDFKNCKFLFSYVRVICNNTKYDLVFNRFYFDENDRVNCILLCPQIEMYNESLNGSKKRDKSPKTKNYPKASDENRWNEDYTYYNFGVDLYSPSKDIAKAFLDFVIATEEKKQADGNG